MELDIYISRKTASGKDHHRHWRKFVPLSVWFREKIYDAKLVYKERLLNYLALRPFHSSATAYSESKRSATAAIVPFSRRN